MNQLVVVGVDGSTSSLNAAEHAARAATLRLRPLRLVHGYLHPLGYGIPINPYDMALPAPNEQAQKMLEQTAAELRERWPGLSVEVRQVAGGPGATLVAESRQAELVVVGSRGLGGFTGLLLGSVSTQVAAHAHCPVLVVRPTEQAGAATGPVLVGVDGSESAEVAVQQAADEAVRRGTSLVLANAWSVNGSGPMREGYEETEAAFHAESVELLATAADAVRVRHPGLAVAQRTLHALTPGQALVEASGEASLLVVGSRGRGGCTGLLLGSVGQTLIQHARCPVLVAHPYPRPAATG